MTGHPRPRIYQPTQAQAWALHELSCSRQPSDATHTRTLRSLERAGLVRCDDDEWALTKAGQRLAAKATERLSRRSA
jgi:DNA-binding IclR family transcriptional regulator